MDHHCILGGKPAVIRFGAVDGDDDGMTMPPSRIGEPTVILINSKLVGSELLETLEHEMGHAQDWNASEEFVAESAKERADVLHDLGFRQHLPR